MKVLPDLEYRSPLTAGHAVPVQLHVSFYWNGRLALQLMSEMEEAPGEYELFSTVTVNVGDQPCPQGEIWIKSYNENEGMKEWLIENQIIEPGPTSNCQLGYAQAERFRLSTRLIEAMGEFLLKGHR